MSPHTFPYHRQPVSFDEPVLYAHGPDSSPRPGAPRGRVEEFTWAASSIFPGTTRRVRLHIPAAYDPRSPAALMVFQDGALYLDESLDMRAGIVMENLVHAGEMPVTIGVFVDAADGHRNAEYDPADDRYATFLVEEILPAVRERVALTDDPGLWAVCGGSSGGSCAFGVAWHRPDRFRRVLAFVASFAQIPGGDPYPALIRDSPPKPLRILMQEGARDLGWDQPTGNWVSGNLRVAAALAERGYDARLVLGEGGHDPNHGGAILPDALRWLWRPGS